MEIIIDFEYIAEPASRQELLNTLVRLGIHYTIREINHPTQDMLQDDDPAEFESEGFFTREDLEKK